MRRLDVVDRDGGSEAGDPFAAAARELERRVAEHDGIRSSEEFQSELTYGRRLMIDFVTAVRACNLAFTRYPHADEWLLCATADEIIESSAGIGALAADGVFSPGRRELRYMLEAVVKAIYCDQALPGDASRAERIAWVSETSNVPRSSVDVIDKVQLRLVADPLSFRHAVANLFGSLSGYTHVSKNQMEERLRRFERGEFIGFEQPRTLRAFNKVIASAYDVILALVFEGVGPAFAGDVFVQLLDADPGWKFHRGRYVKEVSARFDYKLERKRGDADIP
ncbi:MAG: hypothetical protein WBA45_01950 [Microthrixaceae bacterium]